MTVGWSIKVNYNSKKVPSSEGCQDSKKFHCETLHIHNRDIALIDTNWLPPLLLSCLWPWAPWVLLLLSSSKLNRRTRVPDFYDDCFLDSSPEDTFYWMSLGLMYMKRILRNWFLMSSVLIFLVELRRLLSRCILENPSNIEKCFRFEANQCNCGF